MCVESTNLNMPLNLSFSYMEHMLDEIMSPVRSNLVIAEQLIESALGNDILKLKEMGLLESLQC